MLFCCTPTCVCKCSGRDKRRVSPAGRPRSLQSFSPLPPAAPKGRKEGGQKSHVVNDAWKANISSAVIQHTFSLFLLTIKGGVSCSKTSTALSTLIICCCITVFFLARVMHLTGLSEIYTRTPSAFRLNHVMTPSHLCLAPL